MRWIEVDPRVHAAARRVLQLGERRVAGPPALGRGEEDRGVEDEAAGGEEPERQRVQLRERHVPRADHERQEVVAEARHDRDDEQEDHRRPVHRDQLVVRLRVQQRVVRLGELEPDQQRLGPSEQEEHEGEDQVHDPDALVVGRGDPRRPARALAVDAARGDLGDGDRSGDLLCGHVWGQPPGAWPCWTRWRWRAAAWSARRIAARWRSSQASKLSGVIAVTSAIMLAWLRPQSSAH